MPHDHTPAGTRTHTHMCTMSMLLTQAQTKRIEGVVEATESSSTPALHTAAAGSPAAAQLDPESALAWMKQACGLSDLAGLVAHFCRLESLNFHLYEACNQANIRINNLQGELQTAQVWNWALSALSPHLVTLCRTGLPHQPSPGLPAQACRTKKALTMSVLLREE